MKLLSIALATVLVAALNLSGMEKIAKVYLEHTGGPEAGFTSMLTARLIANQKGKPFIVTVTQSRDAADLVLQFSTMQQTTAWHEAKPTFFVSAVARNKCGQTVWANSKGDLNHLTGGKRGIPETARKLSKAFRAALYKKGSELNKAREILSCESMETMVWTTK